MAGSTKNKANSAFSQDELGLSLAINKFSSDMHYKISSDTPFDTGVVMCTLFVLQNSNLSKLDKV